MLYGKKVVQEEVLKKALEIAKQKDVKIIYGAMVGSISQGVHSFDSDYDTRFLYVHKDFPQKIYNPIEHKEEDLVIRYFPKEELYFDKIPLWEFTSFIQFLKNPIINGRYSAGLYHILGWTFLSPYNWDPYGLTTRLMPYLKKLYRPKDEIQYQLSRIDEFFLDDEEMLIKNYLYCVISAASIKYIQNYRQFPPVDIVSLMHIPECMMIRERVFDLIEEMRRQSRDFFESSVHPKLKGAHYKMRVKRIQILDDFIKKEYTHGKEVEKKLIHPIDNDNIDSIIADIYGIVFSSIGEEGICLLR